MPEARVAALWRHPIKSLGRESLDRVALAAGQTMPWDRVWAVAHEATKFAFDAPQWASCQNFNIGSKSPEFLAISARTDEAAGRVSLSHSRRPPLTVNPDLPGDAAALIAWVDPLVAAGRARPARVARVPGRGLTDTPWPSLSIGNLATLRALGQHMGPPLSPLRFRLNIWLEGLVPLQELEWIGREIAVGPVRFMVRDPVVRCAATSANPETGRIDADTLGAMDAAWGHRHLGVYAEVISGGTLACGDTLTP